MTDTSVLYENYRTKMQRIADVRYATAVLQWDQETYLPTKGARFRGQQISTLSEISHRLLTDPELGQLLEELYGRELSFPEKKNVQLTRTDYIKNKKYTSEFIRNMSEVSNKAFHCWIEARKKNSFAIFQPVLQEMVMLKRKETEILGFDNHPYDSLVDEFEKGCTVVFLDGVFAELLPSLEVLYKKIMEKPAPEDGFLKQFFPKKKQWDWAVYLLKHLQFDLEAGRQDISEHPFSVSFNNQDVRITTRIDENDLSNMTWSCIHEIGHALYEQGLATDHYGLPQAEPCSYSIHESQSRLWENHVGRNKYFWEFHYLNLVGLFHSQLKGISLQQFYKAINKVYPSLIRTEADEITYHFHVFIRYELEKKLIDGSLHTNDIPSYWNEYYKKYLNVDISDDRNGCLQDVHWSHGSFGYFPTYTLGSMYAAQFFKFASVKHPQLESSLKNHDTAVLLSWLRDNIHSKGRLLTSKELCNEVTGRELEPFFFVNYLLDKYSSIYNL